MAFLGFKLSGQSGPRRSKSDSKSMATPSSAEVLCHLPSVVMAFPIFVFVFEVISTRLLPVVAYLYHCSACVLIVYIASAAQDVPIRMLSAIYSSCGLKEPQKQLITSVRLYVFWDLQGLSRGLSRLWSETHVVWMQHFYGCGLGWLGKTWWILRNISAESWMWGQHRRRFKFAIAWAALEFGYRSMLELPVSGWMFLRFYSCLNCRISTWLHGCKSSIFINIIES